RIFLLQDDNTPSHKAKKILKFLDFRYVNRLPWPPCSAAVNQFDTFPDSIQVLINREIQPTNLDELGQYLTKKWDAIPMETVHSIIDGMF
ncbi:hypothetical protein CAPTEDRAFT_118772, partial [Capitella teleta]